jgi:hypothetical protein
MGVKYSQRDDGPSHSKAPAEQEDDLVRLENARLDVAKAIAKQTAKL